MGKFNANVYGSAVEQTIENAHKNFTRKSDFDVKNYLDTKLGDENERTITIRILPVSSEDGNFRIAVKTHNLKVNKRIAASGFKSFLCLNDPQVPDYNPDVRCPLCEKSQFYFNEAKKYRETEPEKSKSLFMKACSFRSKTTYIVRVIERGKENEGVKFWRFNENTQGKGIYDSLIALYKQRKNDMAEAGIENYNIFDLDEGRDIVLNLKRTVRSDGQEGVAIQITDKSINKPLTNDVEQGNAWINDVKKWYNAYTVKSHDYLAIIAEDKIPYIDKATGIMTAKTEQDFRDYEEAKKARETAAEAASEVLKEQSTQTQMPQINTVEDNDDDDLPF
jgi:hypothetical protein